MALKKKTKSKAPKRPAPKKVEGPKVVVPVKPRTLTPEEKAELKRNYPIPKEPPHPNVQVRHSAIAGRGAFAKQALKKGQVIIEYTGMVRKERPEDDVRGGDVYLFGLDRDWLIDPAMGGNQARFINHSCEPNCESEIKARRVFVLAMRDIAKGEELTYDYLMDVGRKPTPQDRKNFPCYCGTPSCRGTMLKLPKKK